jgi:hypothetical protein
MTSAPSRPAPSRRLVARVALPLLAFLALAAWGLASPVGSSPDDDFHLPSIWCGLGERPGLCEPGLSPDSRLVPEAVEGEPCYARTAEWVATPEKDASCWEPETALVDTTRVNTTGLYPPVFYATMSVFATTHVEASVLAMRTFNAALFVGFLTATAYALPPLLRRSVLLPFVVTAVPLGAFIVPSTNPSSWAYLSGGTVWLALYGSTRSAGARRYVLAGIAVLAALVGAGARADAGAYACLAVVVVAVLALRRSRELLVPAVAGLLVSVIGAVFYLATAQGGAASGGLADGPDVPPLGAWDTLRTVLDVPDLWQGAVGGWGLGWFDVPLPAVVPVLCWAVVAAACFLGLGHATARTLAATALVLAALWLLPTLLHQQTGVLVGTFIQPRYILPLLAMLAGVATLATVRGRLEWTRAQGYVAAGALSLAGAASLYTTIRRFTVGIDTPVWNLDGDPRWWWSTAPSPMTALVVGSLATAATVLLAEHLGRQASGPDRTLTRRPFRIEGETR